MAELLESGLLRVVKDAPKRAKVYAFAIALWLQRHSASGVSAAAVSAQLPEVAKLQMRERNGLVIPRCGLLPLEESAQRVDERQDEK